MNALEGEVQEERVLSRLLYDLHRLPAEEVSAVLALALVSDGLVVTEVVALEQFPAVTDHPLVVVLPMCVEPEECVEASPVYSY